MSFANCAVIKPPPDLRPLCPDRQAVTAPRAPAWSVPSLLDEQTPGAYLWSERAWWRHDAHPGINAYNNQRGMRFALDAIKAQPLGYLRAYAHVTSNSHPVQPYAYFIYLYQLPVWFPGVAFFVIMVVGLVGVGRQWRRWGGPAALPWAVATIGLVVPVALAQYLYRYAITAVPLACLAAGLAFARLDGGRWPAAARHRPGAHPVPAHESPAQEPASAPGSPAQVPAG